MSYELTGMQAFEQVLEKLLHESAEASAQRLAAVETLSSLRGANADIINLNNRMAQLLEEKTAFDQKIKLGTKLYEAASAVVSDRSDENINRLQRALKESADVFDEIPF